MSIGGMGRSELLAALREQNVQLNQAAEALFQDRRFTTLARQHVADADLDPWVTALSDWGVQAAGVAALAAVEAAWSSWERHFTGIARDAIEAWLKTARAWLACPCEEHQLAASAAITAFAGKLTDEDMPAGGGHVLDAAAAVARHVTCDGSLTVRLPSGNARHGPGGRITDEMLGAIGDKVGRWALHDRDGVLRERASHLGY